MAPRPVTIRLLDPPIHEFLPTERQLVDEIKELQNLRETIRGMQVLCDAAKFMDFPDLKSKVQGFADAELVDAVIAKNRITSYNVCYTKLLRKSSEC